MPIDVGCIQLDVLGLIIGTRNLPFLKSQRLCSSGKSKTPITWNNQSSFTILQGEYIHSTSEIIRLLKSTKPHLVWCNGCSEMIIIIHNSTKNRNVLMFQFRNEGCWCSYWTSGLIFWWSDLPTLLLWWRDRIHMNDLETASVVVIAEYSGRRHRIANIKVEN